jgi:hypothetical protein
MALLDLVVGLNEVCGFGSSTNDGIKRYAVISGGAGWFEGRSVGALKADAEGSGSGPGIDPNSSPIKMSLFGVKRRNDYPLKG